MTSGDELAEALAAAYPELAEVEAMAPDPVYLVGGAVRDLLLGRGRADIDLVVEGDPAALGRALGAEALAAHSRFGTLKVDLDGHEIDIAAARRESYARPGALPTVELGAPIRTDLARRDFTVNAMAVGLAEPRELIDPYDGQADLEAGVLRAIHAGSFVDDPTRGIRAARYAARFGFAIEPGTRELLRAADLRMVTVERRWAELRKLAEEASAVRALELLAGWGLVEPREGGESFALARDVDRLLAALPWAGEADRAEAILAAALGPWRDPFAGSVPALPSEGVRMARGHDPIELVLARAAGATWLDDWLGWREVRLEITGTDLTAAGLEGPAIGEALERALAAKLDGNAPTRADELHHALEQRR
ncbi:MAG: CCA tRNA nucleotidyltransferase [Actinobacteria bacterium]|nr:CCA tRNA nucleotidyltransferase [Actinomycetota bacterium]